MRDLKTKLYKIRCNIFGKVIFVDKFGLKYYLWKDTRLDNTIKKGVRTDDEGLIRLLNLILDRYATARSDGTLSCSQIIAFDVGAYIGVITLAIAKRFLALDRLFSFEPAQKNFKRLCDNIKLNKYSNICPINYGVSNEENDIEYLRLTEEPGNNYLTDNIGPIDDKKDYDIISTISVSKYCRQEGLDKIDILKIDTEGHDLKVLEGASPLLDRGDIYYIFVECQGGENKTDEEIIHMLGKCEYSTFYIIRDSAFLVRHFKSYQTVSDKPPLNILAISPKAPFNSRDLKLSVFD